MVDTFMQIIKISIWREVDSCMYTIMISSWLYGDDENSSQVTSQKHGCCFPCNQYPEEYYIKKKFS